ncbi:VW5B1 protein, partial [Alcedo cyanopectus]|nr:VW5B1 protein [Ceyx cyanopectus]
CAHHSLQVSLQLACGAFLLNSAFCDAVNIPMEKLKWTSPFACHRLALSPSSSYSTKKASPSGKQNHPGSGQQLLVPSRPGKNPTPRDLTLAVVPEGPSSHSSDSGRLRHSSGSAQTEPEGMLWATAVALAWLEHSSASYFIEWELVAAKASLWLSEQEFPEGYSLATVKASAQQLFVLLRHWDENLEFNLLCYNPSSV